LHAKESSKIKMRFLSNNRNPKACFGKDNIQNNASLCSCVLMSWSHGATVLLPGLSPDNPDMIPFTNYGNHVCWPYGQHVCPWLMSVSIAFALSTSILAIAGSPHN